MVIIPNVINMNEAEALTSLETVVLPDGSVPEIIKNYEYSDTVAADVVFAQEPVGEVPVSDATQIRISVSLGMEPDEVLGAVEQEVDTLGTFGLAKYIEPTVNIAESRLKIGWDDLPESYEYNWDNSNNCWYWGEWADTDGDGVPEKYTTPEGTYDNNVRHRIQLYCDGEYVYLRIVTARIYGARFNGEQYCFWIDNQPAVFQIEYVGGGTITGTLDGLEPGTHQVEVRHGAGNASSTVVPGADAYLTKHECNYNAVLELKIPLEQMKAQNPGIDLDNIGLIEFSCPNLTGQRRVRASGASTFPLASAGLALVLIPGSTVLLKRYGKKKERNE